MADFPSIDSADPSTEESNANARALTLGLIAGGLGILATPRRRHESASIPIAQGALQGVNAAAGSLEDSANQQYRNKQLGIEQQKNQAEIGNQQIMRQQGQQRLDIDNRNSQALDADRQFKIAPVGPRGVQMAQPYRDDKSTAPIWAGMSDDDIAKLPYAEYQKRLDASEVTRRAGLNPQVTVSQPTPTADGGAAITITNKRDGSVHVVPLPGMKTPAETSKPESAEKKAETTAATIDKLTTAYTKSHPAPIAGSLRPAAMADWNKGLNDYLKQNGVNTDAPHAATGEGLPEGSKDNGDGTWTLPNGKKVRPKAMAMSSAAGTPTLPPPAPADATLVPGDPGYKSP